MSTQETKPETVGFRLSPQQEYLLAQGGRDVAQCAALLAGTIDEAALRAALDAAVARHEILRTTFVRPPGMRLAQQVIAEHATAGWSSRRESAAELVGDPERLEQVLAAEAEGVATLDRGPLVRGLLIALSGEPALLILTASAACADPASMLVLLDELCVGDRQDGPPDEPLQYADYAEWRHELIAGEDADAAEGRSFWRDDAADRPSPPRILFGIARTSEDARAGASAPVDLAAVEPEAVRRAAAEVGVTAPVFLEAAWHALIARLSGSDELLVAALFDGRAQPDLELAIGPYMQPVPIRSRVQADTSFAEVLDQVRRVRAEVARRQDYAAAADLAGLGRQAGAGFVALAAERARAPVTRVVALRASLAALPLLLATRVSDSALEAELHYDPAAFDRRDAVEIAARFAALLASAVADPALPVSRLALADSAERARLIADGAGPAPAAGSAIPVHRRFEEQVRLHPDRLAVGTGDPAGEMSYAELNGAANRLAHDLRDAGVGPNVAVGLCMDRSPRMLVALLAILKAGGAYVPLNSEHPRARLAHQLAAVEAKVLVTQEHLLDLLPPFDGPTVCVERDAERIDAHPSGDRDHVVESSDLAYVIYTSGSTGLPKGVAVTHGNLASYTAFMVERLEDGDPDGTGGLVFGVVSAISTDLGNTSVFGALASGGCVHLVPPEDALDADAFAAHLGGGPLDVLKITPSHLRALLAGGGDARVLPRRWLVLGGEALSWELVEQVRALAGSCRILNHYGPTETTVGCCTHEVDAERRADAATVPIGHPIAGARAYVLDRELEPVPVGVPGELCVGGDGVAAGYAGLPDETAQRFVGDPAAIDGPARMYRTGDRARYLRDGAIEFLGRVDDQVKVRGFRIEPGEVEAALVSHPAIRQAAVVAEDGEDGDPRLVAYVVVSGEPTVEELRASLAASLPDHMVPSRFTTLEAMPFSPSGKIDRRALPGLAAVQTRREAEHVAPRDPLEQEIAAIWAELLGIERVGVFDDFFGLGGHSLLATQAIIRIRRLHGNIPLRALLAAPTVAMLADVVRSAAGEGAASGGAN